MLLSSFTTLVPLLLLSFAEAAHVKSLAKRGKQWKLSQNLSGNKLVSSFSFETGRSDNAGVAYSNSRADAQRKHLIGVAKNQVTIRIGSQKHQDLRDSTRLVSKRKYNIGSLFIFDVAAMPAVCGAWPSIWLTGEKWPEQGELDVLEGVGETTMNAMSAHTGPGCKQQSNGFSGKFMMEGSNRNNCDVYASSSQGCGVRSTDKASFGPAFNKIKGGVFALEWTTGGIKMFHFRRNAIPKDIKAGKPNPSRWGKPDNFVHPSGCNPRQFNDLMLVISTNLCGTWPDGTWHQDMSYAGQKYSCAKKTGFNSCPEFVKNNGHAFKNAKWLINSIKIYH